MKIIPKAVNQVEIEAEVNFIKYKIVIHEGAVLRLFVSKEGDPHKEILLTEDGIEVEDR